MAGMSSCFFCEDYRRLRQYYDQIEDRGGGTHHEIRVETLLISWNEIAGKHHYGTMTHRPKPMGFDLNYCPECGRKLGGNQ